MPTRGCETMLPGFNPLRSLLRAALVHRHNQHVLPPSRRPLNAGLHRSFHASAPVHAQISDGDPVVDVLQKIQDTPEVAESVMRFSKIVRDHGQKGFLLKPASSYILAQDSMLKTFLQKWCCSKCSPSQQSKTPHSKWFPYSKRMAFSSIKRYAGSAQLPYADA